MKEKNKTMLDKKLIITSILVPIAIILLAKIWPTNIVTWIFLLITGGLYIYSILQINKISGIKKELVDFENECSEKINSLSANDEKFEAINDLLESQKEDKYKYIYNVFTDYKKTLRKINIQTPTGEDKRQYYSTVDIEYFFNEDNLVFKNVYYKTINYISQGLTGIGIFGTFMGIVQGIGGLDTSTSEAMKNSINELLGGVSVSFNTSLYGILFSVLLTFILKMVLERTSLYCSRVSSIINNVITNSNDKEGFKELEDELKKQTSSLEKLATDLALQMEEKFDNAMAKNLDNLTKDLGQFITQMGNGFTTSIMESTASNVEALNSSMKPLIERLDITMQNIEKSQQSSSMKFIEEAISSMKEAVQVGTNDEITKLKETMEVISSKNAEMVETFTSSMENMKKLTLHQEDLIKNTTSSTENFNITTENMRELQTSLSSVIENLRNVSSTNNVSLENIQTTVNSLQVSMTKQNDIIKSVENMMDKAYKLASVQDDYINKFNNISNTMGSSLKNTQDYVSTITSSMDSYKDKFEHIKNSTVEAINTIDTRYKSIASDLSTVNTSLSNTINNVDKNLINKVNDMGNKLNSLLTQLQDYQAKTVALTSRIEKFSDVEKSTQDLWENYKESFDNLNTNINEGVENYTKHINNGVNEMLLQYDASIEKTVHSLKTIAESLGETAEEISDNLEEFNSKTSKVLSR